MKSIYTVVSKDKSSLLSEPTFERSVARGNLQVLKSKGVDAIIISSKLDRDQAKRIR